MATKKTRRKVEREATRSATQLQGVDYRVEVDTIRVFYRRRGAVFPSTFRDGIDLVVDVVDEEHERHLSEWGIDTTNREFFA